jgi:hypothetical protein
MSPIPQNHNRVLMESSDKKIPHKIIKLTATRDIPLDSSSCFESLHELCNIQIDELKKSLKRMTDERDDIT